MTARPVPVGSWIRVVRPVMSFGGYARGDVAVVERVDSQTGFGHRYWVRWETNLLGVERPRVQLLLDSEVEAIDPQQALPNRAARASSWLPVATAPVSDPAEKPRYFLAWLPEDDWGPGGNVHVALRYGHMDAGSCQPQGTNGERKFTGWMPLPSRGPKA